MSLKCQDSGVTNFSTCPRYNLTSSQEAIRAAILSCCLYSLEFTVVSLIVRTPLQAIILAFESLVEPPKHPVALLFAMVRWLLVHRVSSPARRPLPQAHPVFISQEVYPNYRRITPGSYAETREHNTVSINLLVRFKPCLKHLCRRCHSSPNVRPNAHSAQLLRWSYESI